MIHYDVIIIGAGAAGLMAAIEAGKRERKVLIIDKSNKAGKKILMSGGGRCNFTNRNILPECYISNNPHFCKSALKRYTQWDFISLVESYSIPYHEKTLGQLFCDHKSKDILDMLLNECNKYNVKVSLNTLVEDISFLNQNYALNADGEKITCQSLIIATGGLSIPTMGSSDFGYKVARQFNLNVYSPKPGLVPLKFNNTDSQHFSHLAGVSVNATVSNSNIDFSENILFTHKGLSGPAILQISSYWDNGEPIKVHLLTAEVINELFNKSKNLNPKQQVNTILGQKVPKRIIDSILEDSLVSKQIGKVTDRELKEIANQLECITFYPLDTEGYKTAEVTLGGVDCNELSSKTMEANKQPGLYFIGEVVDVTGWLGGYNFQWAWSSGWAAGQVA